MKKLLEINAYVLFSAIIIFLALVNGFIYYNTKEVITITVKDKERITTGSGRHLKGKFIVYTENEVFQNTDSWVFLKFNSTDYQNVLTIGETYPVEVAGWRIPFLSTYRNIIKINTKEK